eukprot:1638796-Pyramimonas_sp.AAC.1
MAAAAPRMQIPLASDRLRVKLGTPISASACADMHEAVVQHMGTAEHEQRFIPVPDAEGAGLLLADARGVMKRKLPKKASSFMMRTAARFTPPMTATMPVHASRAFSLRGPRDVERPAFL